MENIINYQTSDRGPVSVSLNLKKKSKNLFFFLKKNVLTFFKCLRFLAYFNF